MGGASSVVNYVPITAPESFSESLSFSEKLSAGQKLLTSGTLEDVIVLFRQNQVRSIDFTNYVLSGKWVHLVNLDEVKGIYDENFVFEMDPKRSEYHFATSSGYLLKNYIVRHSLQLNLALCKQDTDKWDSPQTTEGTEVFEQTDSVDTLFSNPSSPSTVAPNELPEQFLPLLLVRILSVYLKQQGKECLLDSDAQKCSNRSVASAGMDTSSFDFDLCTDLQQEQYLYFHALLLRPSEILGITLTTGWIAKIRRVVNQVNLPLCICQVRHTVSTSTTRTKNNTSQSERHLENTHHPIVYANDAYCTMHHSTMETVLKRHSGSFYHTERTETEHVRMIQHALCHGTALKVAISTQSCGGDTFANMLALRPIYSAQGEYSYMVSVQYNLYEHGGKKNNILTDLNRVECLLSLVEETMML